MPETTYTRDEIASALSAAAGTVHDDLGLGDREEDVLSLVSAVTLAKLERREATLDEAIEENTDHAPSEVREWWNGWS